MILCLILSVSEEDRVVFFAHGVGEGGVIIVCVDGGIVFCLVGDGRAGDYDWVFRIKVVGRYGGHGSRLAENTWRCGGLGDAGGEDDSEVSVCHNKFCRNMSSQSYPITVVDARLRSLLQR